LLVYELDVGNRFDPFELEVDVTPESTLKALGNKEYLRALVMAFRLNEKRLLQKIFEAVPVSDVRLVVKDIPEVYLARLIRLIVLQSESGPHLEFCLKWLEAVMTSWGRLMRENRTDYGAEIRSITRVIQTVERDLRKLGESNGHTIDYLLKQKLERPIMNGGDDDIQMIEDGTDSSSGEESDSGEDDDGEWMGLE